MKDNFKERFRLQNFDEYMKEHNMTKEELCVKAKVPIKVLNQMYEQDFEIDINDFARLSFAIGKELYEMFEENPDYVP